MVNLGVGKFIERLFNKHKLVRRGIIFWATGTIGWTTFMMFTDISRITQWNAIAYGTNVGLMATVIGLYQWLRSRDQ